MFQALFKGWCLKLLVNYQWSHLHSWVLGVTYVKWGERAIYYFPLYLPGSPRRCLGILELMKVCDEPLHGRNLKSHQPHEANFKLTESHLFCMAWENFPAFWVISQGAMEWEIALCKKVSPKSSRSPSPFPHIKGFQEMNDEGTTFLFWDYEEQERGRELGVHNTGGDEAYSTPI